MASMKVLKPLALLAAVAPLPSWSPSLSVALVLELLELALADWTLPLACTACACCVHHAELEPIPCICMVIPFSRCAGRTPNFGRRAGNQARDRDGSSLVPDSLSYGPFARALSRPFGLFVTIRNTVAKRPAYGGIGV
jgi:hypothetical protein